MTVAYSPTTWNTNDVITKDKLNKIEQGLHAVSKLSGIDIDVDKNWGGRNITNMGKISPKTWLILTGADPLLISKSHDSSTTVTFTPQLDGTGHVKVVVAGAQVGNVTGTRNFTLLKNGSQISTWSQEAKWIGDVHSFPEFIETIEDLSIASGDTLTFSRTSGSGAVTIRVYSTPLVAPYGIVS